MLQDQGASLTPSRATGPRLHFLFLIPIATSIALIALLGWSLTRDPKILPSALIDKPVPTFDLPPVKGRELGLASKDLLGEVTIVNVFASWCIPCRIEHPVIKQLSEFETVQVHGLNYKDKPDDAAAWLNELGDPYVRTGADLDGKVGIEWGVYGVPETFVISNNGRIIYKHVGPVTTRTLQDTILPLLKKLRP